MKETKEVNSVPEGKKRTKREENKEKSKEWILRSSLELFSLKGYDSTTMEMIADRAGISRGLPYLYFESKETILFSILKRHFDREKESINAMSSEFHSQDEFIHCICERMSIPFQNGLNGEECLEMRLIMSMLLLPETKEIIQEWIQKFQTEVMENFFLKIEGQFQQIGIEDLKGEMQYLRMIFFGLTFSRLCFGDDFNLECMQERIKTHYTFQLNKCKSNILKQ